MTSTIKKQLIDQVKSVLENTSESEVKSHTTLVTSGLIDSFAMLELVAFMESEFLVKIEVEDIEAKNFDSIDAMENLIQRLK